MKYKLYLLLSALFVGALLFAPQAQSQTVITQWNFNAGAPDGEDPSTGTGTIGPIGGVTHSGFNSGVGSSDPTQPGLGYQTTTYPAQSTNNLTAGIQVNVSTEGFENIVLSFDLRISNAASRWYQVFYTVNGTDFIPFGTPIRMGAAANAGDTWYNNLTADFSAITAVNDNEDFAIRIVSAFSPVAFTEANSGTNFEANTAYEVARNVNSNYSGGTWRFDMVTISGDLAIAPTTFYYNGSGALTALSSWGANANGTGANPANFTADAQTFIVTNTASISLTAPWTVSGIGSKVVVGNGTDATILDLQDELDAVVDVTNNGTLVLQSTDLPTFGDLDTGSTVEFAQDTDITVTGGTYHHLILSGLGVKSIPAAGFIVNGNLVLENVELDVAGTGFRTITLNGNLVANNPIIAQGVGTTNTFHRNVNFDMSSDADQVISGSGLLRFGRLISTKTEGSLSIEDIDINLYNRIILDYTGTATFDDGGRTLTIGDNIEVDGDALAYTLTGTIVMVRQDGSTSNSNIRRDGANNNNPAVWVFNNLILNSPNQINFRPTNSTAAIYRIGGDLTILNEDADVDFGTNNTIEFVNPLDQTLSSAAPIEMDFLRADIDTGTFIIPAGTTLRINRGFDSGQVPIQIDGDVTIASDAYFINTTTDAPTLTFERTLSNHSRWVGLATPANGNYAGVGGLLEGLATQGFTGSNFPSGVPNVLLYNETGAGTDLDRFVAPSSNEMIPGRGFMFYVYERTDVDNEETALDFPVTLSITGGTNVFFGGNYSYLVSYTPGNGNGWNLLGNLFGAPFDWNHPDMVKTNLNAFAYIWDPVANQYLATGDDELVETGTLASSRIPSFQAFFVKADNATNELTLTTNTLSTEATAHINNASENFILSLSLEAEGMTANTALRFNETFSNSVDAQDAYYLVPMSDSFAMLYTVSDGEALMINSLNADVTEIIHIPLAAGAFVETMSMSGDATLTWPVIRNLPDGWEISLRDTETGMMINLLDTDSYTFELGATSLAVVSSETIRKDGTPVMNASKMGSRFELVVNPGIASSNPAQPELPLVVNLEQNYPNPFNPTTQIRYELPEATDVRLDVFNIQGQRVATLVNQAQTAGTHTLTFDASQLSSGVYVYRLQVGNQILTRKMTLIK